MIRRFCLAVFLLLAGISFADDSTEWVFRHKPIDGEYGIYGGGLGDPLRPTKKDTKVTFSVKGDLAREMFDAMGPDVKDVCTEGTKDRIRKKDHDNLICVRTEKAEYFCQFGFDLRTGKSIGGLVC